MMQSGGSELDYTLHSAFRQVINELSVHSERKLKIVVNFNVRSIFLTAIKPSFLLDHFFRIKPKADNLPSSEIRTTCI